MSEPSHLWHGVGYRLGTGSTPTRVSVAPENSLAHISFADGNDTDAVQEISDSPARPPDQPFFDTLIRSDAFLEEPSTSQSSNFEISDAIDQIREAIANELQKLENMRVMVESWRLKIEVHEYTAMHVERLETLATQTGATLNFFRPSTQSNLLEELLETLTQVQSGVQEISQTYAKIRVAVQHIFDAETDSDDDFNEEKLFLGPKRRRITGKQPGAKKSTSASADDIIMIPDAD